MTKFFEMKLEDIQPSQLFINVEKLNQVMKDFEPLSLETLPPIPVKELGKHVIFTDGHTRALAAHLRGLEKVRVFWDEDELDWEAYEMCVEWCQEARILTIADLKDRVVAPEAYDVLWLERCEEMQHELHYPAQNLGEGKITGQD